MLAAVQTGDENGRGLICTARLHFIVGTALRPALFAGEHVRRCLSCIGVFRFIAFNFALNKLGPMIGLHFLVGHEGDGLGCNFTRYDLFG